MHTFSKLSGYLILPLLPLLAGCSSLSDVHGGSAADDTVPVKTYQEPYKVAPLDEVIITKNDGPPVKLKITTDIPVEYPEGRPLQLIDRSPDEVAALLKRRDSSITSVKINEYRGNRITVTGEVNIQTNFDLQDSPTRVLDAIASAGGFTPLADTSEVRLTRHNAGVVEVYQLDLHAAQNGNCDYLNLLLEPGDRIYVPKSFL
jgi:protein involved in polysaccharide export with SLBB domain